MREGKLLFRGKYIKEEEPLQRRGRSCLNLLANLLQIRERVK